MRRLALPLGLVLGLLVAGSVSAANTSSFTGEWIGNDPAPPDGDGSVVHLYINGGAHAQLTLTDEYGSVCTNHGSSDPFFTSTLTGEVAKDMLVASFRTARCGSVQLPFLRGQTYLLFLDRGATDDPSDDTLIEGFGDVTWHRAS